MNNKDNSNGYKFEIFVGRMYKRLGYDDVQLHHTIKSESRHNGAVRCQFDVTYMSWFVRKYVECKYYNGQDVPFNDVADFAGRLELIRVPKRRGIMVTNSHYSARGAEHARRNGIKLVDREALEKMYLRTAGFFKRRAYRSGRTSLEKEIEGINLRKYKR